MRFLHTLIAAVSLSLVALSAAASPSNPKNGTDYLTLTQPQQTDSGDQVEVTEFFSYGCPHCYALDSSLSAWVKKQGDNIVFKRVPVGFHPSWVPLQKLYYALDAMGKVEEMQPKVFRAIHEQRMRLDNDQAIINFVAGQGIDKTRFSDVYNSFGIQTKVSRAAQLQQEYKVDSVPMVIIDGRYVTSPSLAGASLGNRPEPVLHAAMLEVMDWLVAKSAKGNTPHQASEAKPAAAQAAASKAASATKKTKH